ncbi:MAG: alpha-L-fucosidase 2 [Streptomyces sp.]|nr:alpha-L-fucosidase 2 [Streptomyces sp.]
MTWEPAPAVRWEDAFLSGNGRHGVMVHGDPTDERLIVNHHLLARPNGAQHARAPHVAPDLERLRDDVLAGRAAEAVARTTAGLSLQWVRPFHPAFAVRVVRPRAGVAGYRRAVDFATGVVSAGWTEGEGPWRAETFVSRADDVIVHRLVAPAGAAIAADLSHDAELDGAPADLSVTRAVESEALLRTDVAYPADPGLGYTGWTRVTALGGTLRADGAVLHAAGCAELMLLTWVEPWEGPPTPPLPETGLRPDPPPAWRPGGAPRSSNAGRAGGNPATGPQPPTDRNDSLSRGAAAPPARRTESGAAVPKPVRPPGAEQCEGGVQESGRGGVGEEPPTDAPYETLLARHTALHRTAYDRVTLDLGAPDADRAQPGSAVLAEPEARRAALLERLFAAGRYHLLSSSGMLPPRLTGLWTGSWETAWAGAFTCDANLNLQVASAAVAGLPEVSLAHAEFVRAHLDDWRDNAARLFGARGVVAPAHSDGLSGKAYHFDDDYPLHLWTAGADWLVHPLLDHAAVTGDEEFVRETLVPLLGEVAAFYEDFLTRADADGRLVVVPSYSPENTPAGTDSPVSVNATMDIAAARHALRAVGDDALADRLPPYRVNGDGALAEWAWPGAPDAYDHRHISHLYPVWPLDEINPFDTPELARAAHRALELRGTENDSAHGYLHTALVAARLGDADRVERALTAVLDSDFFHPSLMSAHYPNRHVYNADAAHTLPAVLIEALIHSSPDRIVLLPAAPPSLLPSGTLRGIRTRCRVTVTELTWDHGTGKVRAVLNSDVDLTVNVHVGTDSDPIALELPAGRDIAFGGVIPHFPPPDKGDVPCNEPHEPHEQAASSS